MPLGLTEQPPEFCSAYKPLRIGVFSSRHPVNTTPGESNITISSIKVADATDVSTYGAPLEVGDLFVFHSTVALPIITVGQTVKITGSNIAGYNGVWRVLKVVSDKVKVIACDSFGTAIMGTMEKYYENYTLVATLTVQGAPGAAGQRLYDVVPDASGIFYFDPSDRLRATFLDVFAIANATEPTAPIDAEKYITQQYEVVFEEAYNIPDADGVNVFTELKKNGSAISVTNLKAVNSVQPYHHIDEPTGSPDLLWEDDLTDYTVNGLGTFRWLTYRISDSTYNSTAQRCAYSDPSWLAFLYDGAATTYRLRRSFVVASGASTTTYEDITLEKNSYLLNVGPVALNLPSDVVRYSVALYLANDEVIPPTWWTIDQSCDGGTRFYAFNRFGAIDSYTADGSKLSRGMEVSRRTLTKPQMARTLGVVGDYNRRTYASEPVATFAQSTRTESKEVARWIMDELLSSPDVRIQIYNGNRASYTYIIFDTDKAGGSTRSARFNLAWSQGVDNIRQTR